MTEDNGVLKKTNRFMEKAQNLATIIVGLQQLPLIGKVLTHFFGKAEKKTSELFGIDISPESSGPDEEMLAKMVFIKLESDTKTEFLKFSSELEGLDDRGKDKHKAFLYSIANLVLKNSRKKKKQIGGGGKGKGPAEFEEYWDFEPGIAWAKPFLEDLLSFKTFEERIKFLENFDEFSCLKELGPSPASKAAKKAFEWGKEKAADAADTERKNRQDFNDSMANLRERARNWRKQK